MVIPDQIRYSNGSLYKLSAIVLITCCFALLLLSCGSNPKPFDEENWREMIENEHIDKLYSQHFKDGKYFNPWMPMQEKSFGQFLKWRLSKKRVYTEKEKTFKAHIIPDLKKRVMEMPDEDFITWIGHGTFMIRIGGEYWLTDPMFSDRALLPKRIAPPALKGDDINSLTDSVNVLISHNHYDHLDKKSIQSLPEKAHIFVPCGLKEYIKSLHNGNVTELDWWESIELKGGSTLVCLPTQHWSRRIGQGLNSTLWVGYLLITPDTAIYYGGDSGYFIGYREIGRKFPNIDYALIPVTAYHPRWFMHYSHLNAPEAIDAFKDLGANYFIPTQWGTFQLGDNPPGYPVIDLMKEIHENDLDSSHFIFMDIGQILVIPNK